MLSTRMTARIVGVLYIIGTVAGALSAMQSTPILEAPNVLLAVTKQSDQALLGALFILIMGLALALIPLVMFPILKAHSERLSLGYVVFRSGLETMIYFVSALVLLVLLPLGREYVNAAGTDASSFEAMGTVLLQVNDAVGDVILTVVFALGALMFYYVLYESRLIPRWLSGWGLVAALLWISAGPLVMFGLVIPNSMVYFGLALPIAIQEMGLAIWLIVRGFSPAGIAAGVGETGTTAVSNP